MVVLPSAVGMPLAVVVGIQVVEKVVALILAGVVEFMCRPVEEARPRCPAADIRRPSIALRRSVSRILVDSREFQALLKPRSGRERAHRWGRVRHNFNRVAGTSATFKPVGRFEPMADTPVQPGNPERTLIEALVATSEQELEQECN